jgi:hypothetical protein
MGPMYKAMKKFLRYMKNLRLCQSPIYKQILDILNELDTTVTEGNTCVLHLGLSKKMAIVATLSKLPAAMGSAFTPDIIISAFEDNGQINRVEGIVPSIKAMINTYCGTINDSHPLFNHEQLIQTYYEKVYRNRRIQESSFDRDGIPVDINSLGVIVNHDFAIGKENCQRAKVLSASVQCEERLALIESVKEEEKETKLKLYLAEEKKYELNQRCEERLIESFFLFNKNRLKAESTTTIREDSITIADILPSLSKELFESDIHKGQAKRFKSTKLQIVAFAQLRHPIAKFKGCSPQYRSIGKDTIAIVNKCLRVKNLPLQPKQFIDPRTVDNSTIDSNHIGQQTMM